MKRFAILTAVSLTALTAATAQSTNDAFDNIEEIIVKDFIGTVTVKVASGPVRVSSSSGANKEYPYWVNSENGVITIHSDDDPDDMRWRKKVDWNWRGDSDKAFEKFLEDYPVVEITVPAGTDFETDSAVIKLTAGDLRSNVVTSGGHVEGRIGDIASGKIGIHGSGDMTVGDVENNLVISIHGSGDFQAGSSDVLDASIHGSGDIVLGDVTEDVSASIHGSGDITLGNVGGAIELSSHGSGDIRGGVIGGGLRLESHGSGDLELDRISGPASVSQMGSGDVTIHGGRAENLRVRIAGSGDFEFDGVATNPDVASHGSGDIDIARHEGAVRSRGHGDIRISGRNYSDDD